MYILNIFSHFFGFLVLLIIMSNKIIVISGKQFSGKDTVAKILLETFKDFKRIGIGDAIKLEYSKKNDLTFEQIEAEKHLYREDLIKLGNRGRAYDPDFWLKKILELDYNIIVPDVRVTHEVEMFKARNAFLLRVEASPEARSLRGKIVSGDDSTETGLDNYKTWDYIIDNNGNYETLVTNAKPLIELISKYAM